MRRLLLCLTVVTGALVDRARRGRAGGPLFVTQGGSGVASHDQRAPLRHRPGRDGRDAAREVEVAGTEVYWWLSLDGSWGTPAIGAERAGEGLSHDGRTLVLASTAGPLRLAEPVPRRGPAADAARPQDHARGSFSFDALSPDASRMYLIQYTYGEPET